MYAKKIKKPVDLVKESAEKFHPKETLQTDHMAELDGAMKDAVRLGFIKKPLTKEQVKELVQIPPVK
jgi:hypothetical protein